MAAAGTTPMIETPVGELPQTKEGYDARERYRASLHRLKPREKLFVQEYLKDMDDDRAARLSGHFRPRAGRKLLDKPDVAEVVSLALLWHEARAIVTKDMIVYELKKIGFANARNYYRVTKNGDIYIELSYLTEEQAAAIAEITVEDFVDGRGDDARDVKRVRFKLHDKKSALDSLARHLGMFVDKTEQTGPGGGPIVVKVEKF